MRVCYKNRCLEITEAWIADGEFRFLTVGGKMCGVELADNYNYGEDPILYALCANGYICLENYSKKTITGAELKVYGWGLCEKK